MTIPHTFRVTRDFDLYGTAKAFPRMSRHGLSLPLVMRIFGRCTSVQALAKAKAPLLIRRHVSQMNPTTILRSPIGDIVGCWPFASFRGDAHFRSLSERSRN